VNQAHLITARDFEDGCPISPEMLGRIYRAEAATLPSLVAGIPERTRARLAVFLYGRTHTRELGVRVAATCDPALLAQTSGSLGVAIHGLARRGYAPPTYEEDRRPSKKAVSLAGSFRDTDWLD